MKHYNYLQSIYSSFYSRELYRDVKQNWGAGVVLYLFMLLAICIAIDMVPIQIMITRGYEKLVEDFVPQIPEIVIKKGVATTPENRPYIISDPETRKTIVVIDTSGKFLTVEDAKSKILITQNEIMIKNDNEVKITKFPASLSVDILPSRVKETTDRMIDYSWVIIFPVLLFIFFIYRLMQAVLYAVLGKLCSLLAGVNLNYSDILKLSMVAVTPAIVISTLIGWFISVNLIFYFVITIGYLIFGILANRNKH